jgi:hypothetical protein
MPLPISEEELLHHEKKQREPLSGKAKIATLFIGFLCGFVFNVFVILFGRFFGSLLSSFEIVILIGLSGLLHFSANKNYGFYFGIGWGIKIVLGLILTLVILASIAR